MFCSTQAQSHPVSQAIWGKLVEGMGLMAQEILELWNGLEVPTASLVLIVEEMARKLAAKLICDPLVAYLVRSALESQAIREAGVDLARQRPNARLQRNAQEVRVQMLGGTQETFVVPYYLIRNPPGPGRPTKRRGAQGNGFYPTLELLGIHDRVTPAVASSIGSQLARSPLDEATRVLEEHGLQLNSKTVDRIGRNLATRALEFCDGLILRMADGLKGTLCKGMRLGVGIDGGRVRTRVRYGRKRRSTGRYRYSGVWREPKVFVIYELDAKGRRKRDGLCIYGATISPADNLFELLAAHLCFIGAHLAAEVTFLADKTGIAKEKVTETVDFYHVVERIHDIAKTQPTWTDRERHRWAKARIAELKAGYLAAMMKACSLANPDLSKYFETNVSRLDYRGCRRKNLPIGSGAVESGIRRIVNLRLKGNGIFWGIDNAQGLLCLRCQLVAGRWSKLMESVIRPKEQWGQCAA